MSTVQRKVQVRKLNSAECFVCSTTHALKALLFFFFSKLRFMPANLAALMLVRRSMYLQRAIGEFRKYAYTCTPNPRSRHDVRT